MTTTGDIPARNRGIALAQFRIWFANRLGPDKRGISNDAGPAKSVFSFFNIKLERTSPSPHELRLCLPLLFVADKFLALAMRRRHSRGLSGLRLTHPKIP
jgi:hypothetical protein